MIKEILKHIIGKHKNNNTKTNNKLAESRLIAGPKISKALSKPIIAIYPDGTIKGFDSTTIASEKLGINRGNICSVVTGKRQTAGGLKFKRIN